MKKLNKSYKQNIRRIEDNLTNLVLAPVISNLRI